jgi:peptidoglycan/LPS O-acetylase OafA/YrhL
VIAGDAISRFTARECNEEGRRMPTLDWIGKQPVVNGNASAYRPFGAFRTGLALLVMVQHFIWVSPSPAAGWLSGLLTGNVAVATFFALSGFIMSEAVTSFYAGRPTSFIINRLLRIYPPYLVALTLAIMTTLWLTETYHTAFSIYGVGPVPTGTFGTANLVKNAAALIPAVDARYTAFRFLPIAWAVGVEVCFYLALWLVVLAERWLGLRRPILVLAVVASAVYMAWLVFGGYDRLRFIPLFGFGAAAYFGLYGTNRRIAVAYAAVSFIASLFSYSTYDLATISKLRAQGVTNYQPVQLGLLAVLLLSIPALAKLPTSKFARKLDASLGDLSYPLYLNHFAVLSILVIVARPSWATVAAGMVLAAAVALLAEFSTETPLRKIRDRLRGVSISSLRAPPTTD